MVSAPKETKTDIRQEAKVAQKWSSFGIYCGSSLHAHRVDAETFRNWSLGVQGTIKKAILTTRKSYQEKQKTS